MCRIKKKDKTAEKEKNFFQATLSSWLDEMFYDII